jgi:translation initiation factor 1 (eIF-1/SUI1)
MRISFINEEERKMYRKIEVRKERDRKRKEISFI